MDTVWKVLGRAHAFRRARGDRPLVLLTTQLPRRSSEGDQALRSAGPGAFSDAIELLTAQGRERLQLYAKGGYDGDPQPGFWSAGDLG